LRFPNFEGEWLEKKFAEVGVFFKGAGISKDKLTENGNPCILYGELYTKYKNEVIKEVFSKTDLNIKGLVKSKANDIIIPSSGESAVDIATACCVNLNDILLGGDLNIIRPYKDNGNFISYQLNSKRKFEIAKIAQGSSVTHLYNESLKKLTVNLPSDVAEQNKIAFLLSLIGDRIQTQNKIIQRLETLMLSLRESIFKQKIGFKDFSGKRFPDWEIKKLGEIGSFFSGGTPLTSKRHYFAGNIPFIRSGEINSTITEQCISEEGLKNSSAKMVEIGDVIYALYGATSGEVSISKINGAINQAILCIRTDLNNTFLLNYLKLQKESILSTYLQGGQGNLSAEIIKSLKIVVPHLAEQAHIANFLSAIDKRIGMEYRVLKQYEIQKKYLLTNLFI
jgi:type I restriction enzyme S subunit